MMIPPCSQGRAVMPTGEYFIGQSAVLYCGSAALYLALFQLPAVQCIWSNLVLRCTLA